MALPARFPWHVSHRDRNRNPTVVDVDGKVVAEVFEGIEAAERIVKASNRVAQNMGLEEA